MSTRRLTPAFVATLSALTGSMACNPPRPLPGNLPPQPVAEPEPTAEHAGGDEGGATTLTAEKDASGDAEAKPGARQQLNPRDAEGRTIRLNYNNDGCFVYLPYPELKPGEQRLPGTAPPSQPADCPEAMKDGAYAKCRGGTLSRRGDSCECYEPGNPPRVFASDCPE